MARLSLLPLCFAVALLGLATVHAGSSRLVERELRLPGYQLADDVPIVDPPRRTAGYFRLNRTKAAEMFYFFFEARNQPKDAPVVLWMTGGPGCSSELAIFFENGPYAIQPDTLTLKESAYGWDVNHNMIFVDQPIGTGFSYSDDPADEVHDEIGVANDMLDFLQEFLDAHPDLQDNELFVTGESYAGHYVPAVSHRLWLANKRGEGRRINFRGLAIGNGLTDPPVQYGAYADFAYQHGLIGRPLQQVINFLYPLCKAGADICSAYKWEWECLLSLDLCQLAVWTPIMIAAGDVNVYDVRKKCHTALCYDEFEIMDSYLNRPEVRKALGVGNRKWEACSATVYLDFMRDWMLRYDTMLPEMLADGIRVLVYAGDQDLICNWLGNRRWVDQLDWAQAGDWSKASDANWTVDGRAAGTVRQVGPLAFMRVFEAGHMVPMDQPAAALELITSFTRNKPFAPQPSSAVVAAADGAPAGAGSKERGAGAAPQRIASSFRSREGRGVNGGSEKPQAS